MLTETSYCRFTLTGSAREIGRFVRENGKALTFSRIVSPAMSNLQANDAAWGCESEAEVCRLKIKPEDKAQYWFRTIGGFPQLWLRVVAEYYPQLNMELICLTSATKQVHGYDVLEGEFYPTILRGSVGKDCFEHWLKIMQDQFGKLESHRNVERS